MEVQEVKEQLKSIFRTVINNDKWITIHPNGEDGKGRPLLLKDGETPKEAIDRVYKKEDKKQSDKQSDSKDDERHENFRRSLAAQFSDYGNIERKRELTKRAKEWREKGQDKIADLIEESIELGDKTNQNNKDFINKKISYDEYVKFDRQAEKRRDEIGEEIEQLQKQSDTKDGGEERKTTFKPVKGIMQSLKDDYEAGKINAKEVAKELSKANLTPYLLDDSEALEKIGVKQSDTKDGEEDFEKGTKSTKKDEDRHQKVRDLEDKAYKEFKTIYDNYIDKDGIEGWDGIPASRFDKAKEQFNKKYKDAFDKLESDRFVSFEDFAKRENKQSESKREKKERLRIVYKEDKDPDGSIVGIFEDEHGEYQALTPTVSKTFKTISGAERFLASRGFENPNKADNSKEQDMALLEDLKKLITKVENTKGEEDMEIKNEKVDKRKLIDEVAGIMKSAGCDDEVIRTAIGKMEKMSYDDSEKSADNECEAKEDVKNCGKKVKNEDEEGKKEVKEIEEDVKEDVENRGKKNIKNSKTDYFAKLNEIYNSAANALEKCEYVSRADREKAAEDYFAR